MIKVAIFTEGGTKYGLGHISRCSALYDAFEERGYSPLMIVNGDSLAKEKIKKKNALFYNWTKDIHHKKIRGNPDIAIVDSYLAGEKIYRYFSKSYSTAVFLDDFMRIRYPKGIVLNGAFFAEEMNYPKNNGITYLLGCNYALLQKPFWESVSKSISHEINKVLVTMRGIDTRDLTVKIIHMLKEILPEAKIFIPIVLNLKYHSEFQKFKKPDIKLIYGAGADEMKTLMQQADLAISSSGQTLTELVRMGVPTIAIQTAENQKYNLLGWKKTRVIEYAGEWNASYLSKNILSCLTKLKCASVRKERSESGMKLIDGQGARRIVEKLINN